MLLLDQVHGNMTRTFDHHLHAIPGDLRQFPQGVQLGKLGRVVGVGNEPGRSPSPSEMATS